MISGPLKYILLAIALVIAFLADLSLGSVEIPFGDVIQILTGGQGAKEQWNLIIESRMFAALTAMFSGGALALGGLYMQTLFRNPLAGPSVLGISAGSSLGVAMVMLLGGTSMAMNWGIVSGAMLGALAVLALILWISSRIRDEGTVLIAGLMIAFLGQAVVSVMISRSDELSVFRFVNWGFAGFGGVHGDDLYNVAVPLGIILVSSLFLMKPLNAVLLGKDYATSLGVNYRRLRWVVILMTGIIVGIVTAWCGPVSFIGLAVPHLARNLFRTSDHRILIPSTVLIGASIAVICDLLTRYPESLPLNAVTAIFGAPVVIWVVLRYKKFRAVS